MWRRFGIFNLLLDGGDVSVRGLQDLVGEIARDSEDGRVVAGVTQSQLDIENSMRRCLFGLLLELFRSSSADDEYSLGIPNLREFKAFLERAVGEFAIGSGEELRFALEEHDPLVIERGAALLECGILCISGLLVLNAVAGEDDGSLCVLKIVARKERLRGTAAAGKIHWKLASGDVQDQRAALGPLAFGFEMLEETFRDERTGAREARSKTELHVL